MTARNVLYADRGYRLPQKVYVRVIGRIASGLPIVDMLEHDGRRLARHHSTYVDVRDLGAITSAEAAKEYGWWANTVYIDDPSV